MTKGTAPEHWNDVYGSRGSRGVSWFEREPTASLDAIRRCALAKGSRVVDIGCGASRLVEHLLADQYQPTLLDLSSAALDEVKQRLGAGGDAVTWVVSDVASWRPADPFDCWHDRAVFHFMVSPESRAGYLGTLRHALRPGGFAVIATFAPDGPERCSGLPVQRYSAAELQSAVGGDFILLDEERLTHTTPSGAEQPFTLARFQRRR